MDCPFRPSDLTQRNGRGIRQGNQNKQVHIYTYVTEKTFDAFMFQGVETKQKFISQIMTSKTPVRTMEDIDEKALSYGEIKALATGNKDILRKTELDAEVAKLKILKQNHLSQIYDLENKLTTVYPQKIIELKELIYAFEIDKKQLQENTIPNAEGFSPMIIKDIKYTDKEQAGKAILKACSEKQSKENEYLGEYRGFTLELGFDPIAREFTLNIKNMTKSKIYLGNDVYGNIRRIDNSLSDFDSYIERDRAEIEDIKKQIEVAKIEVQKPFSRENELKEKMKELDKLNISLNINEKEKQVLDTSNGDEEITKSEKDKSDNFER